MAKTKPSPVPTKTASIKPSRGKVVTSKAAAKVVAKKLVASPTPFNGFPKDFLAFFRELAKNNNRDWFAENKPRYTKSIIEPSLAFISAMDLPLGRFADCFEAKAKTKKMHVSFFGQF